MPPEKAVFCREVTSDADLDAIQALRYRVYVEEQGRTHAHADPARRRLSEPLDGAAIHIAAFRGRPGSSDRRAELVGAVRVHLPGSGDVAELARLHPAILDTRGVRTGVVSRLVTAKSVRGSDQSAGLHLAVEAYRVALADTSQTVNRGLVQMKLTDLPAASPGQAETPAPEAEMEEDDADALPAEAEPMTEPDADPIATEEDGESG